MAATSLAPLHPTGMRRPPSLATPRTGQWRPFLHQTFIPILGLTSYPVCLRHPSLSPHPPRGTPTTNHPPSPTSPTTHPPSTQGRCLHLLPRPSSLYFSIQESTACMRLSEVPLRSHPAHPRSPTSSHCASLCCVWLVGFQLRAHRAGRAGGRGHGDQVPFYPPRPLSLSTTNA